jgi:hypothetical protein
MFVRKGVYVIFVKHRVRCSAKIFSIFDFRFSISWLCRAGLFADQLGACGEDFAVRLHIAPHSVTLTNASVPFTIHKVEKGAAYGKGFSSARSLDQSSLGGFLDRHLGKRHFRTILEAHTATGTFLGRHITAGLCNSRQSRPGGSSHDEI